MKNFKYRAKNNNFKTAVIALVSIRRYAFVYSLLLFALYLYFVISSLYIAAHREELVYKITQYKNELSSIEAKIYEINKSLEQQAPELALQKIEDKEFVKTQIFVGRAE